MGTHELKIGDRVRVSWSYRGKDYRPGDQGTVSWVPKAPPDGTPTHYHVSMNAAGPSATTVIFAANEIEPDV
jgi:hypothetical protein